MDIEEEDLGLFLFDKPAFGEIDRTATVNKHEHFDFIVGFGFLNPVLELGICGDWVDFVLDVFALEHFLDRRRGTENILRVQIESTSTATKMTIET